MDAPRLGAGELYRLIAGQLKVDGHGELADAVATAGNIGSTCSPSARLTTLVELGKTVERNLNDFAADATFDDGTLAADKQLQLDFTTDAIPEAQAAPNYERCHTATQASAGVVACFAATRPLVAVGNVDGSISMYDIPAAAIKGSSGSFRANRRIPSHKGAVRALAIHPQGRYLVSCGRDSVIAFHDISKSTAQRPYRTIQDPHGPSSLAVHPSGDYVLVGTGHCNVRMYDASTSQCFTSAYFSDQHTAPITCVDYSQDGKQYVSGCKGGVVKIWDGISSRNVFSWQEAHSGAPVSSAMFSRNGMYLLTAGMDSVVRLWDLRAGGRVLCKYEGATAAKMPWRAVFSHDEAVVMAPDADTGCVRLWDARLATTISTIEKPTDRPIGSVAHSPQRGIALTCSPDMTIAFWASATQAAAAPHSPASASVAPSATTDPEDPAK